MSVFFLTQRAYALYGVGVGGISIPGATLSPSPASATFLPMAVVFGGFIDFKILKNLYLETGGLSVTRGFTITTNPATPTLVSFNAVELPLLLRYFPIPSLSLGVGAYFSHGFNPVQSITDEIPTFAPFSPGTYAADDYGALVSLGIHIKLDARVGLILDARMLYGLPNISPATRTATSLYDIQILGGIRIGK